MKELIWSLHYTDYERNPETIVLSLMDIIVSTGKDATLIWKENLLHKIQLVIYVSVYICNVLFHLILFKDNFDHLLCNFNFFHGEIFNTTILFSGTKINYTAHICIVFKMDKSEHKFHRISSIDKQQSLPIKPDKNKYIDI